MQEVHRRGNIVTEDSDNEADVIRNKMKLKTKQ